MNEPTKPNWIIDTTDAEFEKDAVKASATQLVLVDFWAPWCQPCRILTPNLEEAVGRFNGQVRLVKVNTEVAPETAQAFQIASIPTVYAFLDEKPVDYFQGVIESDEIENWIKQLQRHQEVLRVDELTAQDPAAAVSAWEALLTDDPDNSMLLIGKARALTLSGDTEVASGIIERLQERGFLEPDAEKVKAMISLSSSADNSVTAELRQRHLGHPNDYTIALELAESLAGANEYEEAFQLALDIYAHDKQGIGKQAHHFLLTAFKALPDDNELVHQYRRKLAMLMY